MTINITKEIEMAYMKYLNIPVDYYINGNPILRKDTYPFIGNLFVGLVDYAAGWQAANHKENNGYKL